jgi:hypothetical protein
MDDGRPVVRCNFSSTKSNLRVDRLEGICLTTTSLSIIFAADSSHSRSKLVTFTAPDASQAPTPRASTRSSSRGCYARRHHLHRTRIKRSMQTRRILPSSDSEKPAKEQRTTISRFLNRNCDLEIVYCNLHTSRGCRVSESRLDTHKDLEQSRVIWSSESSNGIPSCGSTTNGSIRFAFKIF